MIEESITGAQQTETIKPQDHICVRDEQPLTTTETEASPGQKVAEVIRSNTDNPRQRLQLIGFGMNTMKGLVEKQVYTREVSDDQGEESGKQTYIYKKDTTVFTEDELINKLPVELKDIVGEKKGRAYGLSADAKEKIKTYFNNTIDQENGAQLISEAVAILKALGRDRAVVANSLIFRFGNRSAKQEMARAQASSTVVATEDTAKPDVDNNQPSEQLTRDFSKDEERINSYQEKLLTYSRDRFITFMRDHGSLDKSNNINISELYKAHLRSLLYYGDINEFRAIYSQSDLPLATKQDIHTSIVDYFISKAVPTEDPPLDDSEGQGIIHFPDGLLLLLTKKKDFLSNYLEMVIQSQSNMQTGAEADLKEIFTISAPDIEPGRKEELQQNVLSGLVQIFTRVTTIYNTLGSKTNDARVIDQVQALRDAAQKAIELDQTNIHMNQLLNNFLSQTNPAIS
ncbi:MAG: hypothetical protein ACOCXQ_04665, partial [Patescibacteria group bacterium]